MKLGSYLEAHGITQSDFAVRIGTTPVAVSRYVGGSRVPHRQVLSRIIAETRGEVGFEDFVPTTTPAAGRVEAAA